MTSQLPIKSILEREGILHELRPATGKELRGHKPWFQLLPYFLMRTREVEREPTMYWNETRPRVAYVGLWKGVNGSAIPMEYLSYGAGRVLIAATGLPDRYDEIGLVGRDIYFTGRPPPWVPRLPEPIRGIQTFRFPQGMPPEAVADCLRRVRR